MNERVNEIISRSITGNGFNKIMSTGNGFNKVIYMYILPSRKEREILLKATATCVWFKLMFAARV